MNEFTFQIDQENQLKVQLSPKVFTPTGTSSLLIKAIRDYIDKPGKTLDLGCGSGITGIGLHHFNLVKSPLYASDLLEEAVQCAIKNYKQHRCEAVVRSGSLFKPWGGEIFDYIVDDVSGVASTVAEISPWFNDIPCFSGEDGTLLINQVLEEAPKYLNRDGLLFFPVLSLSKMEKILETARKTFVRVEKLLHQKYPLPQSMMNHLDFLLSLNEKGLIQVEHKFGTLIWFTEIYVGKMN